MYQSEELPQRYHVDNQSVNKSSSLRSNSISQNPSASYDTADYSTWNELNVLDNETQEALDLLSTFDKDEEDMSIASTANIVRSVVKSELLSASFDEKGETRKKAAITSSSSNSEEVIFDLKM